MASMNTASPNSLSSALSIQLRVIHALLMREVLTRYGRKNFGFLWLFLEPMLFTLGVTALWFFVRGSTAIHGQNIPIIAFAITGYSTILLWRNAVSRCIGSIEPNRSLLHHQNVTILDIFISRLLLEIVGATFSFAVLLVFFIGLGLIPTPNNILLILTGWFLLAWFAAGLGMTIGIIATESELIDRIWHTITYLMFPLSGALFLVDWLPTHFQELALWIPMVHSTEMIRHGYFGDTIRTYENPIYLLSWNLILSLAGLVLIHNTSRKL